MYNKRHSHKKKIWIDLDNSPHVPFFKPILEELKKRDYAVMLTVRDCFQVCGLADLHQLNYDRVGRHYGKNKILKLAGLLIRSLQMAPIVWRTKPALAVSHGSRSQLLLSAAMRIPSVLIADYEYVQGLVLVQPNWLFAPEIIPQSALKINGKRIRRYPGIKEDVYVPQLRIESGVRGKLGLNEQNLMVTIRPPATEAHYHRPESEILFKATIDFLGNVSEVRMVLLPRNEKQAVWIKSMWPQWTSNGKMIIPDDVVDGLNLIWHSDLVISGGGTMNREAAALGVPVYTTFRGKIGAVDRYLVEKGRLTILSSAEDVKTKIRLKPRHRQGKPNISSNRALHQIVEELVNILEA
jgi:predicted glycosyltransferase